MPKDNRNPSGSALVFSLIIMLFMLVIAMGIFSVSVMEKQSLGSTGKSSETFQIADSVAEDISKQMRTALLSDPDAKMSGITGCAGGVISGASSIAGGTYNTYFYDGSDPAVRLTDCAATDISEVKLLKVVAQYRDTTRAIEVPVGGCLYNYPDATNDICFWQFNEVNTSGALSGGAAGCNNGSQSAVTASISGDAICGRGREFGSSAMVTVDNNSVLDLPFMTTGATLEFWFKPALISSYAMLSRADNYSISMDADGYFIFSIVDSATTYSTTSCFKLKDNDSLDRWYYLAATLKQNEEPILYIVGPTGLMEKPSVGTPVGCTGDIADVSGESFSVATSEGSIAAIGIKTSTSNIQVYQPSGGSMDEVRFSKRMKTEAELEMTYKMLAPNSQL